MVHGARVGRALGDRVRRGIMHGAMLRLISTTYNTSVSLSLLNIIHQKHPYSHTTNYAGVGEF